ncbi:cyclase family protein [Streptomyces sp. NPDC057617]|uniref:cyclase family protein n=1 Tax=Streptomyces sp. NPDC057617 TaxID=3346184 RepID=UPI00369CF44C
MPYEQHQDRSIPEQLQKWPGHIGNWHRWPNDRGTLNLLTPEVVLRGVQTVRTGQVFPCARPIRGQNSLIRLEGPGSDVGAISDRVNAYEPHIGPTHMDGLGHMFYKGFGFNGYTLDEVFDESGARKLDMMGGVGIVTRGVFVDVARKRGVDRLQDDDCVYVEDIAQAAERIEPGDAFVVRLGPRTHLDRVDPAAGFHVDALEFLGRKDISVLVSDSPSDRFPSATPELPAPPIHILAEAFYGLPLVHDLNLEAVGEACAAQGRNDFLLIVAPPNFHGTAGQVVQPIVVL